MPALLQDYNLTLDWRGFELHPGTSTRAVRSRSPSSRAIATCSNRIATPRSTRTGARALSAADDPAYLDRVNEKQTDARAQGVSGIPTFCFGDVRVVGCQPLEALARAAERAGAKRR